MENNNGYLPLPKGFATTAIHAGQEPEQWESLNVVPPLVMSSTFKQRDPVEPEKYSYSRFGNPSRHVLEHCLATLEEAKYGVCFSSGTGAVAAVLGLFKSGDHIIYCDDIFYGTSIVFDNAASLGITTTFVDATVIANVEKAIKPNTKLICIESPTNPMLKVIDIQAVSKLAKKNNIILVVDNTFLTPYFQKPLTLGADMVLHSLSKYLGGHSDVVMGAVVLSNEELHKKLRFIQQMMGAVPSPFDCYQVNRSLKTLAVRMKQHNYNGLKVAEFLEKHPKIIKVIHPGLPSHPQYELFKRQTAGHSGMIAFYLKGELEESKKFLTSLKLVTHAVSLGGYDSTAKILSVRTPLPRERLMMLNITDNVIRLSVGLEDVEDLIEDLNQALNSI